jgi:DNA-binding XRE family transcriptional regulator
VEDVYNCTARIVQDVRKLFDIRQEELAKLLGITQPTISKIENATLLPDLTIWLGFAQHFKVLDPYCCQYGKVELASIPSISQIRSKGWASSPWKNVGRSSYKTTARPLAPIMDFLLRHSAEDFKDLCDDYNVGSYVTTVLNLPVPENFVRDLFRLQQQVAPKLSLKDFNLHSSELGLVKHLFSSDLALNEFRRIIFQHKDLFFADLIATDPTKKTCSEINGLDNYAKSYPALVRNSFVANL